MASDLLSEIEAFLAGPGAEFSETSFGLAAVKDGKFVFELRRGRRVWPETAAKVRSFIHEHGKPKSDESPPTSDQVAAE